MAKQFIKKSTIKKFWSMAIPKPKRKTKKIIKETAPKKAIQLEYGNNLIIPVFGEHYGQNSEQTTLAKIYKKYGNKIIDFVLAPQNQYQKEMGWPEEPFLNVIPAGAENTTKDNWLGYISPSEIALTDETHIERQKYIDRLCRLGKTLSITIKGKVIKEDDEYSVLLFASRKQIDEELAKLR